MDLFVDNTSKGFFLDLLTNYVQLTQSSKVQIIRLSTQTLSLVESKEISFPSLPLLVDDAKKKYTSPLAIALYILEKSRTKHLLLGQAKDDFLNVSALFELLERKKPLDLLKHFGDILEKRTFLNKFHISLGDLYLFSYFYETIQHWDDETKVKNSSLFRWFYHIQSLPGIESFLTTTGKGLIRFPKA